MSRAESQMHPAHDAALAVRIESCKQETCCHFIQPADMTGGWLRHIPVSSDYDILTPVNLLFSHFFIYIPNYTCLSSFVPKFLLYYRKTLPKLRCLPSLKQPFGSLLLQISKIYKMWKAKSVVSLFLIDLHPFFMLSFSPLFNIIF